MATKIEDIMKLIGWTDGYHIPVLNKENEKLSKKIEDMLKEKAICMIKAEDLTNRVNAIDSHIKDMKLHHQQNQALIYSYQTYEESEDHMIKVAMRDEQSIKQNIFKFSQSYNETCKRNESLEDEIRKLQGSINKIKSEAQLDHGTLVLWEEEIMRKEEENQVIEFYVHEDDIKAKEQNLQLERLQIEAKNKQQRLEKISYDIQSQELALERTSNLFRKMHANRQFLIQKWEACVSFMGKRDEEIMILRNELNGLQKHLLQQKELLQEEEHFLVGLERNNRETELKTQSFDREAAVVMKRKDKIKEQVEEINNEISNTNRNLANVGKQLEQERCQHKFLAKGNIEMYTRVEKLKKVITTLEDRLKSVKLHHLTANDRAMQLEEILKDEESNLKDIEFELKNVQDSIFRNQSCLHEMKDKECSLTAVMKGIESSMKLLANEKIVTTKKLVQKFQLIYHLDYLIQKQESRIARMVGNQESSKQEELVKKIDELEIIMASKNSEHKFLSAQKAKLEDEERRLLSTLEANGHELKTLSSRKDNESLSSQLTAKRLKEYHDENQNLQVEENVLRLKISKAQSSIDREGTEIFSLEKQRLELDTAMQERRLEIMMEKDVLEMKRRAVSDEVSLLRMEVKHMQTKISQLQKRYEISTACFNGDDGIGEEPISLIRFNLKIAQEKQELQEEGDKLEKQIHKAEKEICAMEATLRIVGGSNEAYKHNLTAIDEEAPELIEKNNLEVQLQIDLETRRKKNMELIELQNDLTALTQQVKELDEQIAEMASALKEETILSNGLASEIQDQTLKQTRADHQAKRLQLEVRRMMGATSNMQATFDERDYYLRQLAMANKNGMMLLAQLVEQNPEMGPMVDQLLEAKGLTKTYESFKMLQRQQRGSSQAARSSLTMISPMLMPPVNTPVTSSDRFKAQSSQKSSVAVKTVSSSMASPTSPTPLTIDGGMFTEVRGRTSGTYKGAVSSKTKPKRSL